MGDGGEGTLNAILVATQAYQHSAKVRDALGRTCEASWGWHPGTQTAFIELAEACGLQKLAMDERTALYSSTYGVGELICRALDHGAKRILLLLGGSATNDAGAGMLQALGAKLTDARGDPLPGGGVHLTNLDKLDLSGLDPRLREVSIEAAIDVDNPLVGHQGASVVFGPQKGASSAEVAYLDTSLKHFADITTRTLNTDYRNLPGTGAAGGIGFAAHTFLQAILRPGIELVMHHVGFHERLEQADLVITGEGKLDEQSLSGKTPIGISRLARKLDVPIVVIAGSLGQGWQSYHREGVTAAFSLVDGPMPLTDALERCEALLSDRSESIIRLLHRLHS